MNIDEAIEKLQMHGYLVESRRKYVIGEIINAVFQDNEFKPGDKENEFIGTAMREYDVDTYYKWDPNTDNIATMTDDLLSYYKPSKELFTEKCYYLLHLIKEMQNKLRMDNINYDF